MQPRFAVVVMVVLAAVSGLLPTAGASDTDASAPETSASSIARDRILVKPRSGIAAAELAAAHRLLGGAVLRTFPGIGGLEVVAVNGRTIEDALAAYRASGLVEYAEPDFSFRATGDPNDPLYRHNYLWGLHNVGKAGGTPGADIHAPDGWAIVNAAPGVVVALIDSGLRYTHEDLAANVWTNPGEIPGNGIDDDQDGYVDDVHGINAVSHGGEPKDESGHGTAVAGTLGAVGNNGKGIVGVAWRVQLLPCKFLAGNAGYASQAIECLDFALQKGARIVNASWGGNNYSQALYDAIAVARDQGVLFVAAAGNEASDNDTRPFYPAAYDLDNIVAVAATTRTDELAPFSDYGAQTVDLGAPGVSIVSTFVTSDAKYAVFRGTSLATPYVSGAFALLMAHFPAEGYASLINRLYAAVDPLPSLAGKCVTGGRLNLANALGGRLTVGDATVAEGDSGTIDALVPVTLAGPFSDTITVDWATADGTARQGEDYAATSGTLTFAPGTTAATIQVPVLGDTLFEDTETIVVRLSNPVNASLANTEGRITILNDDPGPTVSFESSLPVSVHEGVSGATTVLLPVVLSAPAEPPLDYHYRTCGGSAEPGVDYTPAKWGTVTFPSGVTRAEIEVVVFADNQAEPTESFFVDLAEAGPGAWAPICLQQKRVDILDGP